MIVLMAQIFLALVIVAALMAVCDGCRKVLRSVQEVFRSTGDRPPEGV